jgi:dihydrofolate synthase/folylpolyglutamate synthase
LGLERARAVWRRHSGAALPFPVITISGTNGKGSVAMLLESIYRAAGYHTACYTSPHLVRYNERVRVDGRETEDEQLCRSFERIDAARGHTPLTYFEFGTLAAMDVFLAADIDVAILEVGLGGRLDVVNLFDADVAIVSSVGLDHMDWLGSDRESIGREKAGIFRSGRPAICGDPDPPASLLAEAQRLGARLLQVGRDFEFSCRGNDCHWQGPASATMALPAPAVAGEHQWRNLACVLMAVAELADRLPVNPEAFSRGLLEVRLPARLQTFSGPPTMVVDVAHNPQAVEMLASTLRARQGAGKTFAVVGMMQDKDIAGCMRIMAPLVDRWFLAALPPPRGATAARLRQALEAVKADAVAEEFDTPLAAVGAARTQASADDRIVVFGSFETAGVIMRQLFRQ